MTKKGSTLGRTIEELLQHHERKCARVTRVLHDEICQTLSALGLQLDVLRMDLESKVPEIASRTAELQQMLEQAIVHLRALIQELHPSITDKANLVLSLERLLLGYQKEYEGSLDLQVDIPGNIPPEVANSLFHIAELALSNAVRHAASPRIHVLIKPVAEGIMLEVTDTGHGFDVHRVREQTSGLGLALMEHYASLAGVQLSILSRLGSGTTVRAVSKVHNEGKRPEG